MTVQRSHVTRVLHLALLLIVLHQLFGSLIMERPAPGEAAEWPYFLHQTVGVAGVAFATLFWLWTLVRHPSETPLGALVPWFSRARLAAIVRDVAEALLALQARRAPRRELAALASAVHGLGLATASYLAFSGAAWLFVFKGTAMGRLVIETHAAAGILMWAYVVGHAGMAALHALAGETVFARMFWTAPQRAEIDDARAIHAR